VKVSYAAPSILLLSQLRVTAVISFDGVSVRAYPVAEAKPKPQIKSMTQVFRSDGLTRSCKLERIFATRPRSRLRGSMEHPRFPIGKLVEIEASVWMTGGSCSLHIARAHDFARPLAASHATEIPNRSLTTLSRFYLQPVCRSVVCTGAWPG
jgi:hypothetical protein